jgi:DNA ligase 1
VRQPMLAAKATEEQLQGLSYKKGIVISPKLDGIRTVKKDVLLSRSMKPIPNRHTQELFNHPLIKGMDAELCVGSANSPSLMQTSMSGLMSWGGTPDATMHAFDLWDCPSSPFNERSQELAYRINQLNNPRVFFLKQIIVHSYEELLHYEELFLADGYEGLMARLLTGHYKYGRSTVREELLIKVKRFTDGEAIVIGYEPLYRNENDKTSDERGYTKRSTHQANRIADDLLGALHVRCCISGKEFNIGSGFTEAQRRTAWDGRDRLIGRTVKYKHFDVTGVKDKPRIPIFLGFRSPIDL